MEDVEDPFSGVCAGSNHHALVAPAAPFLFEQRCAGLDDDGIRSADSTVPVITTISRIGVVNSEIARRTASARHRPGDIASATKPWIVINGQPYLIDVLFRMMKVIELSRAMGFATPTHSYAFAGSESEQVRQIGNAVSVDVAEALAYEHLRQLAQLYFGHQERAA